MAGGQQVGAVQQQLVGGGVVQPGLDAVCPPHRAEGGGRHGHSGFGVGPAAGGQTRPQTSPLFQRQAGLLDGQRRRVAARDSLDQLAGVAQPACLDEAEGRARAALEAPPLLAPQQRAFALLAQHLAQRGRVALVGHAQPRRLQAGQLRPHRFAAQRPVRDEHREEAGEAQRLHRRAGGLECTSARLGAHVDAEHRLHGGHCSVGRRHRRPHQPATQGRLVAALERGLPQPVVVQCRLGVGKDGVAAAPGLGQTVGRGDVFVALLQQPFPGQPHGQQVHDLVVVLLQAGQGCRRSQAGHQLGHPDVGAGGGEGRLQVFGADAPGAPLFDEPRARHQHCAAGQPRQRAAACAIGLSSWPQ